MRTRLIGFTPRDDHGAGGSYERKGAENASIGESGGFEVKKKSLWAVIFF